MEPYWKSYSEGRPEQKGVYLWRVPHVSGKFTVVFYAHMVERLAGLDRVLSPSFDHWDGYRVIVPHSTQWANTDTMQSLSLHGVSVDEIEGVVNDPCPFCGLVPEWRGLRGSPDGGVYVESKPHRFNKWWLECCKWARTPHFASPVELSRRRNTMLRAVKDTEQRLVPA